MLSMLADWVEKGEAPGDLEVSEQKVEAPSFASCARCAVPWPAWPQDKRAR